MELMTPRLGQAATINIKEQARVLGFEKVGIVRVGEIPEAAHFAEWLAQGYQGAMGYMERTPERRMRPQEILPGARSIVCVAKNYYTERQPASSAEALLGTISRYAWGKDYHNTLFRKLTQLRDFIIHEVGGHAKICVDTSAVLEKLWAREAGLGWQGKHSNVISRDLGSWLFLGEILVDVELATDQPHARNYCGRCTRCIDLCPTRAIVAPYVVDSRRCIAYLTIEYQGVIPRELRPLMGNLIFGCDICQDVCPWNKFSKVSTEAEFMPQGHAAVPYLARLAELNEEEFKQVFKGSPIRRAKRAGFLRNVAIALGNSGSEEALSPLLKLLSDQEPLVRAHAAWGLGHLVLSGGLRISGVSGEVERALREGLALEGDEMVKEELRDAQNIFNIFSILVNIFRALVV